jgi:hypothetical protein
MAMARPALALLASIALIAPASAAAATGGVKVRLPSDGGTTFAHYRVKAKQRPTLEVRNPRRLGGVHATGSVTKVGRRRYAITLLAFNPRARGATSADVRSFQVQIETRFVVTSRAVIRDVFSQPNTQTGLAGLCRTPEVRTGLFQDRELVVGLSRERAREKLIAAPKVLCASGGPQQIRSGTNVFAEYRLDIPGCLAKPTLFQGTKTELRIEVTCVAGVISLTFGAQVGNPATACLPAPGDECAVGDAACGRPEFACFGNRSAGGLPTGQTMVVGARWGEPVPLLRNLPVIGGLFFPNPPRPDGQALFIFITPGITEE